MRNGISMSMDLRDPGESLKTIEDTASWVSRAPVDVLLQITDFVELPDKFNLSHTCRAWRAVTVRDWPAEVEKLAVIDRVIFWMGMAYTWPSYWACWDCIKPVLIPNEDAKQKKTQYIHHIHEKAPPSVPLLTHNALADLQQTHVQFALKYTRLFDRLDASQRQYLKELMSPRPPEEPRVAFLAGDRRDTRFKIVNGRFLLQQEASVPYDAESKVSIPSDVSLLGLIKSTFIYLNICPHLIGWQDPPQGTPGTGTMLDCDARPQDVLVQLVKEKPDRIIKGACEFCTTDYEVWLDEGGAAEGSSATVSMRTWSDLGDEMRHFDTERRAFDDLEFTFESGYRCRNWEKDVPFGVRDMWLRDEKGVACVSGNFSA